MDVARCGVKLLSRRDTILQYSSFSKRKRNVSLSSFLQIIELTQQKVGEGWDGAYLASLFFLILLTGFVTLVAASHDGLRDVRNAVGL